MPLKSGDCVESNVNKGVKSVIVSAVSPVVLTLKYSRLQFWSFRMLFKMNVEALSLPVLFVICNFYCVRLVHP
jgi:hypothetical protein